MISFEELKTVLDEKSALQIFNEYDVDKNGMIEISEFLHAVIDFESIDDFIINWAFQLFDRDQNKFITFEEVN